MEDPIFDEIKVKFNKALDLLAHGVYDQAIVAFGEVLELNPKSAEAHLNLGNAHFHKNDIETSIECFKKALEIDPTLVKAYGNIGSAYFKIEQYKSAIGYWLVAANINPKNATTYQNLGVAYQKLGIKNKAFRYFEEFAKYNNRTDANSNKIVAMISNGKKVAYHNLEAGATFQKQKQLVKAAQAYIKSIEAYPNLAKAHLNLGSIFYMNDNTDKAISCWEQAIKLDKQHFNTHCNLAVAYDKIGEPDEALYHYIKYVQITGGKTNDAKTVQSRIEQLKKILEEKKELIKKHLNKGNELYREKDFEEALEELNKYILLAPSAADAKVVKDRIIEINNQLNPVKIALENSLRMGDEYMKAAQYDKAIAAFNRYLSLSPPDRDAAEVRKKKDQCTRNISNIVSALLKSD